MGSVMMSTMHGHEPGCPSLQEALVLKGPGLICLNSPDADPLPPIAFLRPGTSRSRPREALPRPREPAIQGARTAVIHASLERRDG
jgi:hypothetical protein